MTYSIEIRSKALTAYEEGQGTQEEIASIFQVSISSFKRWLSKLRRGEPLHSLTENSGRPKKIDKIGEETIKRIVAENPSITLSELSDLYYKQHKVVVGRSVLSRTLQGFNLRYKKISVKSVEKETNEIQKKARVFIVDKRYTCARPDIYR